MGVDEDYLQTAGYEVEKGRNISEADIAENANLVLIGAEVARTAFGRNIDPLNRFISVGNGR